MKKVNVTFSIPEDIHKQLQSFVGQRKMSAFVAQLLSEALKRKKEILKQAYIDAENDSERNQIIHDWSGIESEDWE